MASTKDKRVVPRGVKAPDRVVKGLDEYITAAAQQLERQREGVDPDEEIQFNVKVPRWLRDAIWREAGLRSTTLVGATHEVLVEGLKRAADRRQGTATGQKAA